MNHSTFPRFFFKEVKFLRKGFFAFRLYTVFAFLLVFSSTLSAQLVRTAGALTVAALTTTRDLFRTDIGGGTVAGANGSFGGVRREINWDGVPDAMAAPNKFSSSFFNVNSPRGVVLVSYGTGSQVSANSSASVPVEFGNIDPSYPSLFAPFSPQRLFTALGSTITEVNFFVPGTTTPALTTGFGVVFSDVNLASVTSVEIFDKNNVSLTKINAPAVSGNETFSFVSMVYPTPTIARVRITSGNTVLGSGTVESIAVKDLVVMDDFLYGEPVAICTPPTFLNDASIVLDASQCGNDGNISILPKSGTAPFLYSIDGGTTYVPGADAGHTFQNVAAGMYQLRLKDANGCESAIVNREVKTVYPCVNCIPPTFLNDKTIVLDASCAGGDGNITIVPLTGTAPFMYSINGGATYVSGPVGPGNAHTFQNLAAGMYQLRLKDANGCQSAVVTREVKPNAYGSCFTVAAINPGLRSSTLDAAQVNAYPNPSQGQFRIQLSRFGSARVQVQILDARGSVVQTKTINPQESSILDINLQGKAKGLYFVRVISDKGAQIQKVQVQ